MASSATPTTNPYTFQRASTIATRQLVSDSQPTSTTTYETPNTKHPEVQPNHPTDRPEPTHAQSSNYESAAANTGMSASAGTFRPGVNRQQSWSLQDSKREHTERMLRGEAGQGYQSGVLK